MLGFPQIAGRIERQTFFAAVTDRPDFRQGARLSDERIAGCRRAVGRDANNGAEMAGQLLRFIPGRRRGTVADSGVEKAVASEDNAPALIGRAPGQGRLRMENNGDIVEGGAGLI